MKVPGRRRKAAEVQDPRAHAEQASAQLSAGLKRIDALLDQSESFSQSAKVNLEGFEQGIAAINAKAPSGDDLSDVDALLDQSESFSQSAKVNLEGVKEDIAAISHEAETRRQLSERG